MNELYHHGILGQRWGKKNGPPYPLDIGDHSKAERQAGWRKSLSTTRGKDNKVGTRSGIKRSHRLTSDQKRIILIGAGLAAAGLATYGAYKAGALDSIVKKAGETLVDGMGNEYTQKLRDLLNQQYFNFGDVKSTGTSAQFVADKAAQNLRDLSGQVPVQPKRIHESISDSLRKANPLYGDERGVNNCIPSSIAGIMRSMGFDVTAKSTGGKQLNPGGVIEECFKGVKVKDGRASIFGKSRLDAERILLNKFGSNAKGIVGIQTKKSKGDGHAFSWIINNGKVSFYDFQNGWDDSTVSSFWGKVIDPNGYLTLARLDDTEIDFNNLKKYIDF